MASDNHNNLHLATALLCMLLISLSSTPRQSCSLSTASATSNIHLDFYVLIIPQNQSMLQNPNGLYNAVRTGAPATVQKFTFGVLNTFDIPISKNNSTTNPADVLGRVQGWYGDCGQDYLALCLAQTFTYDDGKLQGTFSLVGVSNATAPYKEAAIVGGTGDFAFCLGVAGQHRISDESINNEENAWFHYNVTMRC